MSDIDGTINSIGELMLEVNRFHARLCSCKTKPGIWALAPDLPTELALIRDHLSISARLIEKLELDGLLERFWANENGGD